MDIHTKFILVVGGTAEPAEVVLATTTHTRRTTKKAHFTAVSGFKAISKNDSSV